MGKILFIRGGAVGDFILTVPAMRLVRETLPNIELEILGHPSIAELALVTGIANRVRSIEDARLAPFFAPGAKLDPEWCAYLASFDVVISYLYDPDGLFAANLKIAGVETLIIAPFRPFEGEPFIPAAIQFAKPLEQLALFLEKVELDLPYPDSDPSEFRDPLIFPEIDSSPVIALHPGSGSPKKNWSYESWIEVLVRIYTRVPGAHFLITSGEAEEAVINQFLTLLKAASLPYQHLCGFSLSDLGAVYRKVDFFLGHDSGVSHLAASAGAPGLLLFGPTNPAIWAPVSENLKILRSRDGSLGGISVTEVMETIDFESYSRRSRR